MQAETTVAFEAFVHEATALLRAPAPAVDLARFDLFVRDATALLLGDAREYVEWLARAIEPLEPALEAIDVLHLAGIDHDEDRYTELLAWLLDPESVGVGIAGTAQQALAEHVGAASPAAPVRPQTQVWTDDGVPDLVLPYPGRPLIVEAKTRTTEHTTPATGLAQTLAYPPAVRRWLGLDAHGPCDVVFLTLDRSAAANAAARSISYLELAWVLSVAVEPHLVAGPVRDAWHSIVGHLARCAVPQGFDLLKVLGAVRRWRQDPTCSLVSDAAILTRCEDLLPKGRP